MISAQAVVSGRSHLESLQREHMAAYLPHSWRYAGRCAGALSHRDRRTRSYRDDRSIVSASKRRRSCAGGAPYLSKESARQESMRKSVRLMCEATPRGARPGPTAEPIQYAAVSIHAPTGSATLGWLRARRRRNRFQSTRPRGARRRELVGMHDDGAVSIHAPTGGATRRGSRQRLLQRVSIHAPTGGATSISRSIKRSREVSIHAPTGGATGRYSSFITDYKRFNPRAHGGRDATTARPRAPPRRFNPRAHGGRDLFSSGDISRFSRFQSTRPRGARRPEGKQWLLGYGFQSTRPRGARH